MASVEPRTTDEVGALTIEHVTNSLGQIETWLGAVRSALAGLDPGMPLLMSALPASSPSALKVKKDCPPPTHKTKTTKTKPAKKKPAKKK